MFVQAYPELEPKFSLYPEKFRALWQQAIDRQKNTPTVWNIGFRGQGDKPLLGGLTPVRHPGKAGRTDFLPHPGTV
ncbi:MAG: glycosyl hydrolase 115 family protein [Faecalibacterium sp.]